jgi:single-stranded DNA-binding protein
MNDLNSILIEGKINGEMEKKIVDEVTVCDFWIASNRFVNTEKETSFFKIEAIGKLAETVFRNGRNERGIRIVGRLKQNYLENRELHCEVTIIPEHIEFRPNFKDIKNA